MTQACRILAEAADVSLVYRGIDKIALGGLQFGDSEFSSVLSSFAVTNGLEVSYVDNKVVLTGK